MAEETIIQTQETAAPAAAEQQETAPQRPIAEPSPQPEAPRQETVQQVPPPKFQKSTPSKNATVYEVKVPLLNVREKASMISKVVDTLVEGDEVEIATRTPQGFGKLADGSGYIKLDFVEKTIND